MRNDIFIALGASVLGLSVGCSSAHVSGDPAAGIYDLSARGEADRCSPARATGSMGAAYVVTSGDVLGVAVPDPTRGTMLHVSLSRPTGYHDVSTVNLRGCTGASLERTFTVLETTSESVSVAYRERWIGMESCGEAMRALMPAAPGADCDADMIFDYALTEACGASCEVGLLASGPTCLCD